MKIDLHTHTIFSDGHLSPRELVLRAHTMQVDVLAITDHDTVAGLDEAHACQSEQKRALTIVDGVEVSTGWHSFDIHIVGLNVDREHHGFREFLLAQEKRREDRAVKIADKLAKCGYEGVLEHARKLAGKGQLTRAHFARVLVNHYQVSSMNTAFRKYLGKGKRAAVKPEWPTMAEAINAIQAAGGQAVIAHPAHYDMTAKWLRRLVNDFTVAGGDAIEAACPGVSPTKRDLIYELAQTHKLYVSAGSDFHFPSRWTELGKNLGLAEHLTPVWHNWALPGIN